MATDDTETDPKPAKGKPAKPARGLPIGSPLTVVFKDGTRLAGLVTGAPISRPQAYSEGKARRTTRVYEGLVPVCYRLGGEWRDTVVKIGDGYACDDHGNPDEEGAAWICGAEPVGA